MGLQTKIVVTVLSIVACLSVMVTGIVAILLSGVTFYNNETLVMANIQGNLYGYRFGAGDHDIYDLSTGEMKPYLLYRNGEVANEAALKDILRNVTFGTPERFIEYIFVFELDRDVQNEVWINLEEASTTSEMYYAKYQYCFKEKEPSLEEWGNAKEISGTMVVNQENRYLWLRACLGIQYHDYESRGLETHCKWTFTFSFMGAGVA